MLQIWSFSAEDSVSLVWVWNLGPHRPQIISKENHHVAKSEPQTPLTCVVQSDVMTRQCQNVKGRQHTKLKLDCTEQRPEIAVSLRALNPGI